MNRMNTRWMMMLLAMAVATSGIALAAVDKHKEAKEAALAKMNFKPVEATAAQIAKMKTLQSKEWTVPTLALKMNLIPAGKFMMGSPATENHRTDEETQHEVTISKPFYMGVYEVTQAQFYRLTMPDFDHKSWMYFRGPLSKGGAFHYRTQPPGVMHIDGWQLHPEYPMESFSWLRAMDFCKKLNDIEAKAGRLPAGYAYRLPTEAEWEYACRAGTSSPYNIESVTMETLDKEGIRVDKDKEPKQDTLKGFAWVEPINDRWSETDTVGKGRTPNKWGLYDMHGNVAEWCLDSRKPFTAAAVTDPVVLDENNEKIIRGGGIGYTHGFMRSASRYTIPHTANYYVGVGMRLVLAPVVKVTPQPVANTPLFRWTPIGGPGAKRKLWWTEPVKQPNQNH